MKHILRWLRSQAALITAIIVLAFFAGAAHATTHEFYKGKTVRIIVGASPGGGYDLYSRTIARHMGKRIPGNPTFVVENMAGAAFLISANYMYKVAKPDGLTIGNFIGGLFMQQLLGIRPGIEFDARKFEYIGVPAQDGYTMGLSKATGITSMEKWMASKTPVKFGGVGPGSGTDDIPKVLMATLGLPIQLVTGYKGTADVRLAFNSGEVQGVCNAWESFRTTWRKEVDAGDVVIVLQNVAKPYPDLPRVPLAIDFAKTDEARKLIQVGVNNFGATARAYVLPPGTSKDRVQLLRKAFLETLKDREFLAEAQKAKLDINPVAGAELERMVHDLFKLEPGLVTKLKGMLS